MYLSLSLYVYLYLSYPLTIFQKQPIFFRIKASFTTADKPQLSTGWRIHQLIPYWPICYSLDMIRILLPQGLSIDLSFSLVNYPKNDQISPNREILLVFLIVTPHNFTLFLFLILILTDPNTDIYVCMYTHVSLCIYIYLSHQHM